MSTLLRIFDIMNNINQIKVNLQIGEWKVVEYLGTYNKNKKWKLQNSQGNFWEVFESNLKTKIKKSHISVNVNSSTDSGILGIISKLGDSYREESFDYWKNTPFEDISKLSPDKRGQFGEELFFNLLNSIPKVRVDWMNTGNTNLDDGIYDMKIQNLTSSSLTNHRTEIKFALSGVNTKTRKSTNTWQHENLYEDNVADKVVFIDSDRDCIYITVMKYGEIPKPGEKFLNKTSTPHLNGLKFDTSECFLRKGIVKGITIKINFDKIDDSKQKDLQDFILKCFD